MHSSNAEFDEQKSVTLIGTVKGVDWSDPHVLVHVEAKEASGQTKNWRVEMGSVAEMEDHGWAEDTVKLGDRITVEGNLAKSEPCFASARMVEVPGGKKFVGHIRVPPHLILPGRGSDAAPRLFHKGAMRSNALQAPLASAGR